MSERTRPELESALVVDDDPRNCRLLEGYLRLEGYQVRTAEDGPAALRMAEEKVPDVVLLDVMMPGMSGYEVCRILKNQPATRLTQIMLVTALAGTAHQVEGLDTGADDYIAKPVRREEFLARVRSLLRARRLLLELEGARAQLVARNEELELKKTLAQTLVHDLKSPLSVMVGNLDLLEWQADQRTLDLVRRCKGGASRMLRMILDLLDVESLEDGHLEPRQERVDAVPLVRRALDEISSVARQRHLTLTAEFGREECMVNGDSALIRRVLDNLLSNAMEHSPAGSTVTVGVREREEGIEFSVMDRGRGIPEDQREHVFDKYARLALRQAGVHTNRGLGLTFCRLAVEAHGGSVWIEDAPGGGALFRVLLPAADPAGVEGSESSLARTA